MQECTMKLYGSWASLVVIFLCAAAGSHIIADRVSAHLIQKKCMADVRPLSLSQTGGEALNPTRLNAAQSHDGFLHRQLCSAIGSGHVQASTPVGASVRGTSRLLSHFVCECNVPVHVAAPEGQPVGGKRS
jgi:hypothetical protein